MESVNKEKTVKKKVRIINKLGLHARAAAKFVSHASHYLSQIEVKKEDKIVNGKSIMGVMMLAASKGTQLELTITGEDADAMCADIVSLLKDKFGEDE